MNISINIGQETVIKEALQLYMDLLNGKGKKYNACVEVLNKIAASGLIPDNRTPRVVLFKQYQFNFIEGGWNTVWAKTLAGAKRQARAEYKDSTLVPDYNSFFMASESSLKSAGALFY